ncbi:MAG: carboxymuconolactone decarboxylase family protein [Myxococcota bacterium]
MAIRELEWGEPLLVRQRVPELEAIARKGGPVQGGSAYFSGVPWVYLAAVRLNQRLLARVALDHDLADLAGLVVSRDNSCRYCFAVQRALLRTVGFAEERILELEETLMLQELDPPERMVLEFAHRVSRANPLLTPRDVEPLRAAGFDELAIREVAVIAGLNLFFNRISTLGALPPAGWEALPDRWLTRLARPLARRVVNARIRRRDEAAALSPDQRVGPWSYLVNALDGHPFAGELRTTLDDMLASELLPRRTKALCFGVVARALGCDRSEQEAAGVARDEGLSADHYEETLANLASPALDPTESRLVPFSRQTVWYQVPDLQRRTRELAGQLEPGVFLETIAVVSLANVVCRLGFLAE